MEKIVYQINDNQLSLEQQIFTDTQQSDGTQSPITTYHKDQYLDSSHPTFGINEEYSYQYNDIKKSNSNSSTFYYQPYDNLHEENSNPILFSQINHINFENQDNNHNAEQQQESNSMNNNCDSSNTDIQLPLVDQDNQFNYQLPREYSQQQQNYYPFQNDYIPSEQQDNQNYDYISTDSLDDEEERIPFIGQQQYLLNSQSKITNIIEQQTIAPSIFEITSDQDELVRHRSKITKRRLPHSQEIVVVQERTLEKKKQFKNHFKNFLKKAIPYLIGKMEQFNANDEDHQIMLRILETFQNKTSKDDVLFLIKNFNTLEEDEFNRLQELNSDESSDASVKEQKINPDFRILLFAISHLENQDSYEEYTHIMFVLRKLNTFNRKWLLRFTMVDYIPKILRVKANKQDQFFTNNYIKHVLLNAAIIE